MQATHLTPSSTPALPTRRQTLNTLWALPTLALGGCGGGGDSATTAHGSPATPVAPSPSPTPTPVSGAVYANLSAASLGQNSALNGSLPFPAGNAWNTDISSVAVDPNSDNLLANVLSTGLRPDFGAGTYNGGPIGIPYVVVSASQARVNISFNAYPSESDAGPYPVPGDAPMEGGSNGTGDRHVLVIDKDNQRLYELFGALANGDGSWQADCGAVFHLDSNSVRPTAQPGWTSADAAGLPIFPGLVRYEEAALGPGGIAHALRFTLALSRKAYVPPATHFASANTSVNLPPMGMRVRLKASYVIPTGFSNESKAILQALKTYGMFLADNGSNLFMSGAPDARWNNSRLVSELGQVLGADFEVLRMDDLVSG
jgi:hypothetical protein